MHFFLQVWLDADANVFLEINRSSSLVFLCFIYCVGWYLARLGRRITCNKCDLFKLHVNDIYILNRRALCNIGSNKGIRFLSSTNIVTFKKKYKL